jgi:uncharacterized membrane-anchored protein
MAPAVPEGQDGVMALRETDLGDVVGRARVGRRTKDLVTRLHAGDIAVIDHLDLDGVAAIGLVEARVAAVVNASSSVSGRYPNPGPLALLDAGIPLLDDAGSALLDLVREGQELVVRGADVLLDGQVVATGTRQTEASLNDVIEQGRHNLGQEIQRFATNTLEYVQREKHLVTELPPLPEVREEIRGRHALVVVRGEDYRDDLVALRRSGYLREVRPVVIAVDGGADALLEIGVKPHIVIGDFDSVSSTALTCGAQLIVHAYPGGHAPGAARLDALGLSYDLLESSGTSEDIALLLAHAKGAELIVAVGTHSSLVDFLDKGREGMASTFLVRLRVGRTLVDARGVNRLYRPVVGRVDILLLSLTMLASMITVVAFGEPFRLWLRSFWLLIRSLVNG